MSTTKQETQILKEIKAVSEKLSREIRNVDSNLNKKMGSLDQKVDGLKKEMKSNTEILKIYMDTKFKTLDKGEELNTLQRRVTNIENKLQKHTSSKAS